MHILNWGSITAQCTDLNFSTLVKQRNHYQLMYRKKRLADTEERTPSDDTRIGVKNDVILCLEQ